MKKMVLRIIPVLVFSLFLFGCQVSNNDEGKVAEFLVEANGLVSAGELYFYENNDETEVSINTLVNSGYFATQKSIDNYSGLVKNDNGTLYVSYSNGEYKTSGLISADEINKDHIEKE